jgi:hypothetical protein
MPEAGQYLFDKRELLELLIKRAGVHEGRWVLIANFNFAAVNVPTPDLAMPSGVMGVNKIGIERADPNVPAAASLDAAVVNPAHPVAPKRPKAKVGA